MTDTLFLILAGLIVFFGSIVFIGAPYVPTKHQQISAALDVLSLSPGQLLLELGSGDGRVAREAARRGIRVDGYELNPVLVIVSLAMTWKYRDLVTIHWQNYWRAKWPKADGIFVFSGDRYMAKLDKKIQSSGLHPKVASFAFKIPGLEAARLHRGVYYYDDYALAKHVKHR